MREDCAVLQSLRIVTCKDDLHGAKKPSVELRLLVGKQLADAVADAHSAALEFDDADGDAVHIQHEIGAALVATFESHFLGNAEIVFLWVLPIEELQRFRDLSCLGLDRHTIAQQLVHFLVVAVEAAIGVAGFGTQFVQCDTDLLWGMSACLQPVRKQRLLNVAVAAAIAPVAKITVLQFIAEKGENSVLCSAFGLADGTHIIPSPA